MDAVVALVVCMLLLASAGGRAAESSDCRDCVCVNLNTGQDTPECLHNLSSSPSPCKTLSYVFSNSSYLDHRDIVLEGDQLLNHTIRVSGVEGLIIQGRGNTIRCSGLLNSEGAGTGGIVFESVSSLKVINIVFEGCGVLHQNTDNTTNFKHRSAVYVTNSTDIELSGTTFNRSSGRGLSLHGVGGRVEVSRSCFVENTVVPAADGGTVQSVGGGLHIVLEEHNKDSRYLIKHCMFTGNRANSANTAQFLPVSEEGSKADSGGGINFFIASSNSSLTIQNCTFSKNHAQYGGGMFGVFAGIAHNNTVSVIESSFTANTGGGGGALQLVFAGTTHNSLRVHSSHFTDNYAGRGGAVVILSSSSKNRMNFTDCTWTGNSALTGAAISIQPPIWTTVLSFPTAVFSVCSFARNKLVERSVVMTNTSEDLATLSGIVDTKLLQLVISGTISFTSNKGSPIFAISSRVTVMEKTLAHFVGNKAVNGAGMALRALSFLELHRGSRLVFESNHASELGGAIFAISPHETDFVFYRKCFISHVSSRSYIDTESFPLQTLLNFTNNTACNGCYGQSIFADSLVTCRNQMSGIGTPSFQWENVWFSDFEEHTISTSPAVLTFTVPSDIAPGEKVDLGIVSLDDLRQAVSSALEVTISVSTGGEARTSTHVSDDGLLQFWGTPGTEFNLTLHTQNARHVSATRPGRLGNCPIGLTLEGEECVCSASIPDKHLIGIVECDMSSFRANLQIGYWIGCTPTNQVITGYCPLGYCDYSNRSTAHMSSVPRSCQSLEESSVLCVQHRRGVLCGECEEGYSVYFHSENFLCGECPYGATGLVFYLLSELAPLLLMFAVIMAMKLKMTSGFMQSLLLFTQTITFINLTLSPTLSKTSQTLVRIHTFLLGFLNLDFFRLDQLSFRLWSGATVLDNLAFRYVTTFFTILLLVVFIIMVKQNIV